MLLRRVTHQLLALVLVAGLPACGGSSTDPGGGGDGGGDGGGGGDDNVVTITLSNYAFTPSSVTVDVGTTVRWQNGTNTGHTATPDGHSEWNEWSTSASGQTFEHTFKTVGTYAYYCSPHQSLGMDGVVTVQ